MVGTSGPIWKASLEVWLHFKSHWGPRKENACRFSKVKIYFILIDILQADQKLSVPKQKKMELEKCNLLENSTDFTYDVAQNKNHGKNDFVSIFEKLWFVLRCVQNCTQWICGGCRMCSCAGPYHSLLNLFRFFLICSWAMYECMHAYVCMPECVRGLCGLNLKIS